MSQAEHRIGCVVARVEADTIVIRCEGCGATARTPGTRRLLDQVVGALVRTVRGHASCAPAGARQ